MKTFFVADTHLDRHGDNTVGRAFENSEEMSREIVSNINGRANRGDRIIILGDFAFKEPQYWRTQLTCKNITLVLGNHDPRSKCLKAFGKSNIRDQYDTKCKDHPTFCSHYPHSYWSKSHYGSFHLFGHVHDQRTRTIEEAFPGIRAMDVGVDSAKRLLGSFTCFSEDEIYDLLIDRPGHDLIEFYEQLRKWKK